MASSQRFGGPQPPEGAVSSGKGVVSAGHPFAVQAGLAALSEGGSAVDAIVAAAFAAFVAEPNNAGIGGYGHLSAFLAGDGEFVTVDHGPRAPAAARPEMFEIRHAAAADSSWPSVVGERNATGHLAVAVPGAVAGLWAAHQRAGRLAWSRLLEPAIAIAAEGLEITWGLMLEIAGRYDEIRSHPPLAEIVLPNGRLPRARTADGDGDRLNQRDLAATLRTIARDGPDAFYQGTLAGQIAAATADGGGILTAQDLSSYEPKVVAERPERYRDLEYVTAGDTVGYETLGILDRFDLRRFGAGSSEHYHLLAEAMGHAFVDGATYSSDPDFTEDPVHELGGPEFAASRAAGIGLDRAAPRPIVPIAPWRRHRQPSTGGVRGTTQVVCGDAEGNLVSLITTIGADFGSLIAVPGTGIILNNSMINYDPRPNRGNSIAPGKMPFFAVPTLVATRGGRAALAAAGSGGYPILAGVINTVVEHVDHGFPIQTAIDRPRVHSQGEQTFIDARVPEPVRARLAEMGHELIVQATTPGELPFSRVSAVAVDDGDMKAGAGPSWSTAVGSL
jgi:gamma-glutamyltranspeptidase/glutathione hydrolase